MDNKQPGSAKLNPGLITGGISIARNLFALAFNRVELAALELSEVRACLLKLTMVFGLWIIAAWFAIAYWSALLVYLTWDSLGWKILLILAAAFTGIAIGIFLYARATVEQGKLSMPATMAELRNDRDALL